ncbi:hypothetical protein C6P08_02275 [Weissella confusa]|uniref:hypothetical protein n=1 Tax=Weissella TaxID=46255 RepID=UPI0010923BC2|nr:hypothetical protein [Weissella confusa]MBJ7694173.1 hypothetical protein [Weissella confusa]QBZ04084.1 hypothetical protein C6P08_02275 [Weissella confusa]
MSVIDDAELYKKASFGILTVAIGLSAWTATQIIGLKHPLNISIILGLIGSGILLGLSGWTMTVSQGVTIRKYEQEKEYTQLLSSVTGDSTNTSNKRTIVDQLGQRIS